MTYKPDPNLEAWLEAKLAALRAHIAGQEGGLKKLIDARLKTSTDHAERLAALAVLVEGLVANSQSMPAINDQLLSLQNQINLLHLDLKREVERTARSATSAQIARLMRKAEKKG